MDFRDSSRDSDMTTDTIEQTIAAPEAEAPKAPRQAQDSHSVRAQIYPVEVDHLSLIHI